MNAAWFGARLKELREQAGISQKELAARAGLGQRSISNWEQGMREPSWPNVVALSETLGVSCEAFLQSPTTQSEPRRGRPRKGVAVTQPEGELKQPAKKPPRPHRKKP
jgi:transcriptional regulator with XRE-family HTH domain